MNVNISQYFFKQMVAWIIKTLNEVWTTVFRIVKHKKYSKLARMVKYSLMEIPKPKPNHLMHWENVGHALYFPSF